MNGLSALPIFVSLFATVFVWFGLSSWIFRRLAANHPETYQEMGSPTLLLNNSPANGTKFLRFIAAAGWKDLNDDGLTRAGRAMRIVFVLFLGLAGLLFFAIRNTTG